jgi:hypothetical protein
MAFFSIASTLAHAFGRAFVVLIGYSCKPVHKTYFTSTTVVSPDGVYQSGAHCTLLKYSPSTTMDPTPLDKVVAYCFLVSHANCTYVALTHDE